MSASNFVTKFNVLEWINQYFDDPYRQIDEDGIDSILHFSLMWNMFESLACNKYADVKTIQDKVNDAYCKNLLRLSDYYPFLQYFQDRYLDKEDTNQRFGMLNFRKGDKKELVESVLKGELSEINNIVLALLIIVFRFRNNLFHGEKKVYRLSYQVDNFMVANQILATFLSGYKAHT